jgi:hypothetical protein
MKGHRGRRPLEAVFLSMTPARKVNQGCLWVAFFCLTWLSEVASNSSTEIFGYAVIILNSLEVGIDFAL